MITVILNASAGSFRAASADPAERVAAVFKTLGAQARIEIASDSQPVDELARRAAMGPDEIIAAGGGDGTISAAASALVGTGKILGVLPLGTLNHFAKDLKIPLDLENAVRTLLTGRVAEVDVGEVNGRIFINNSSIGLYPQIVRRRDKEQQAFNRGKWSAFVKAVFAVWRRYRFLHVRVRAGGREVSRTTPFVFVGNNEYTLDGFGIGGREAIDGGHLCFWLARRTRPLGLVWLGLRALVGRLRGARDFEAFCGARFEVAPDRAEILVALDGETVMMETPLRYESRPRALRVMTPARQEGQA